VRANKIPRENVNDSIISSPTKRNVEHQGPVVAKREKGIFELLTGYKAHSVTRQTRKSLDVCKKT